jgi:hypothetical protein
MLTPPEAIIPLVPAAMAATTMPRKTLTLHSTPVLCLKKTLAQAPTLIQIPDRMLARI